MNHDNFTEVTSEDAPRMTNLPAAIAWANGYNTCLERTNAAELLEALKKLKNAYISHSDRPSIRLIHEIEQVIKKATDESR